MKKITLLPVCLLFTSIISAQINTYIDRTDFETAYTAPLMQEDFSGGPTDPAICGTVVSSAGNDCFAPNVLIDGFELTASGNNDIVFLPEGFLPSNNPTPRLGANAGANATVVSFSGPEDVFAVGFSIHVDNNANFSYRVYDTGNNLMFDENVPFTAFYGIISSEPISHVEIEAEGGVGELLGDLVFGNDNVLNIANPTDLAVHLYPNPVNTILNVAAEKQIKAITIFNLVGQKIAAYQGLENTFTLDLTTFEKGVYVVGVNFSDGQKGSLKLLKE